MKRMKKMVGLLLTMVMVLSMTMTAFAAEVDDENTSETYSITINNKKSGHTYEAYQIFVGDLSKDAENDNVAGTDAVLSNVKWGDGIATYNGEAVTPGESATEIAKTLTNKAALDAFIEKITLGAMAGSDSTVENEKYVIDNLEPGYYLIKDMNASLDGKYDSYTSFIIEVIENSEVNPKSDIPEVEKKVKDVNDSTGVATNWQDSADYDIGDAVPFKLTGTLPSNYSEYVKYTMTFHDTLSAGLDQPVITSVYLVDENGIKVNDFAATDYKLDKTTTAFTITFADLKACSLANQIDDSMKIVVEYTSVLKEGAVVGIAGNPNKVKLEFSNDPNFDGNGEPETGETPEDTVIVFTFETIINKVDPDGNALTGAEFTLEKRVDGTWTTLETIKNDEGTTFTFTGLDDGLYRLTETETPEGFNTIDPIYFEITAEHEILSDNPALTDLQAIQRKNESGTAFEDTESGLITFEPTASKDSGKITADVENNRGTVLPETGGMGTTLFYVFGTILVAGAAIMLITKKRMSGVR